MSPPNPQSVARISEVRRPESAPAVGRFNVSQVPAPIALVDASGCVLEANDAFRAVEAAACEVGFTLRERFAALYAEALARNKATRELHEGGKRLTLEACGPASGLPGIPVYAAISDYRGRTDAEIERLYDLVWACDADGRLTELSRNAARVLGPPPALLHGRLLSEVFVIEGRGKSKERLEAHPDLADPGGFRDRLVRTAGPDGERRWLMLAGLPRFGPDDRFIGHVGIGQDVTRLIAAERQLREARRNVGATTRALKRANAELQLALDAARRSDEMKTNFLANLNHEFHTPLNAIIGTAEMMALGIGGQDADSVRSYGERVAMAGRRLASLFDDALAMASLESGACDIAPAVFDARDVLGPEVAEETQRAHAAGLDAAGVQPLPAVAVNADPVITARILRCLLDNAIKFTRPPARIGVQAKVDHDSRCLCLAVWDQGPGVPADQRDAIFEPFSRGQATEYVASTGGTGLGLAMARAFARLQGGDVDLETTGPRGSRFRLSLPLADA